VRHLEYKGKCVNMTMMCVLKENATRWIGLSLVRTRLDLGACWYVQLQIHPQTYLDLWHPTLRHSIHIQYRDTKTLSIKGPAHNRRCTLVCAKQSHPSGPPNAFRQRRNLRYSNQYSARLTTHPNDQILTLMVIPGNRRLRIHVPNDLPNRFLV
jgi:hypothetical protein